MSTFHVMTRGFAKNCAWRAGSKKSGISAQLGSTNVEVVVTGTCGEDEQPIFKVGLSNNLAWDLPAIQLKSEIPIVELTEDQVCKLLSKRARLEVKYRE